MTEATYRAIFPFEMRRISAAVVVLGLLCGGARAQYFGKNKVHYTNFRWQVLRTEHFEVYFYPEEERIAKFGASVAEEAFEEYKEKLGHTPRRRIPLIIYSAPTFFQQTNVVPYLLPESVGGFTEFVKGRVVVPHTGSFSQLRRAIRHELVHVFVYDKLEESAKWHNIYNLHPPPPWFNEGMAEYLSYGWDSRADMVMRDAVLSGVLVPLKDIGRITGTYLMYKEGQSLVGFMVERYGEKVLAEILDNWWKAKDFSGVFFVTTGESLEKFAEDWEYHLKKRYYPLMAKWDLPSYGAEALTSEGMDAKPTPLPDGSGFAFLSDRSGYSDIYVKSFDGKPRRVVRGGRTEKFETFHLFRSKMDISREGTLAFVARRGGKDVLYLWDLSRGKVVKHIALPEVVELSSPSWSPDGSEVVVSGLGYDGTSDLYVVDVETGRVRRLTRDHYDDRDPSWSPDGSRIAFSSSRTRMGEYNIFAYDLPSGKIYQLTSGPYRDVTPSWSPDGELLAFSSDREGPFGIYLLDGKGRILRACSVLTGALDPEWTPDGKWLLFTGFEGHKFLIYRTKVPEDPPQVATFTPTLWRKGWVLPQLEGTSLKAVYPYKPKFSLDIAQSQVVRDPEVGVQGGVQFGFTDVLGDHHLLFLLGYSGQVGKEFLKRVNFASAYADLSHRLHYSLGAFHLSDRYYDLDEGWVMDRRYGGEISLVYPLSRFRRVEADLLLRRSHRRWLGGEEGREALLLSGFLGYVLDTSLWGPVGPIDGRRYSLLLGYTLDPISQDTYYAIGLLDLRHYIRISRRVSFALRLLGAWSEGKEPWRFYMGGSWTFRGYPWGTFRGRHLLLLNNELRFPLIDDLKVAFPFGVAWLRAVRGAAFLDIGNAWEEKFPGLVGSLGFGVRARVSEFLVLRFDWAWRTDFRRLGGLHREFFFGWSY